MAKILGTIQLVAVGLQTTPEYWKGIPEQYHPVLHTTVGLIQLIAWAVFSNYAASGRLHPKPLEAKVHARA